MSNDKLRRVGLKKLELVEEDRENIGAGTVRGLRRAWALKHRHLASGSVVGHALFRKEPRWPGYYDRGAALRRDDENWHVQTVSRRDPQTGAYTMSKAPCYHFVGEDE